jgi:hypothetical protein
MKIFITELTALDYSDGQIKKWSGDRVHAPTWELAQQWCDTHKGYLKVVGELQEEIPCIEDSLNPDWANKIDYKVIQNN